MSLVASELNYSSKTVDHGSYTVNRVVQQSGTLEVVLNTQGGQTSTFEISPSVINFSKSSLSFDITLLNAANDTVYLGMYLCGVSPLRQITLATRSGLFLADITNCAKYLHGILPLETTRTEMLTQDQPKNVAKVGSGYFSGMCAANSAAQLLVLPTAGGTLNDPGSVAYYMANTTQNANADNTGDLTLHYDIPLSNFKHTILAYPCDLYFASSVFLTLSWEKYTGIGFAMAASGTGNRTVLGATTAPTISNLFLNCALETNTVAMAVARQPKTIPVEFCYQNQISLTGTGSKTLTVRLSRAQGLRLRKIIWIPYLSDALTTTVASYFDHDNTASRILSDYYTTINGARLQQYNPICANGTDFLLYRNLLKDTCLSKSSEFYRNWMVVEDFTSKIDGDSSFQTDGLSLE